MTKLYVHSPNKTGKKQEKRKRKIYLFISMIEQDDQTENFYKKWKWKNEICNFFIFYILYLQN